MSQAVLPKIIFLHVIFVSAFILPFNSKAVANEIPGSRGLLSCRTNENLELQLYVRRGNSLKRTSQSKALNTLNRFSKTLRRATRNSMDFSVFLQSSGLAGSKLPLSDVLSETDIIQFNRAAGALKVSQIPAAENLSLDLSGEEAFELLSTALIEIPAEN